MGQLRITRASNGFNGSDALPTSPMLRRFAAASICWDNWHSAVQWRGQMEGTQLRSVIKFVADMNKAVKFYRDVLGLQVKFESPGWSEFVTGETHSRAAPGFRKEPGRKSRIAVHRRRRGGFLSGHERQGRSIQHAAKEAGFRWGAGAVRRFRRRILQRGRRGCVGITQESVRII